MKKPLDKKTKIIIGVVAAVVVIAAIVTCVLVFGKKDEKKPTAKKEEVVEDTGIYSYLTGEPVTQKVHDTRPFAVMIENTKECQPTYGLTSTGVIYEAPVEGGYTRLMAIFDDACMDGLEKIGNVRSCRPYYVYFAKEFEAIYTHYGQSAHALPILDAQMVPNLSGLDGSVSSTVFFRTDEHKAPHNAYTKPDMLKAGADKKGASLEYPDDYKGHYLFATDTNKLESGVDAAVVKPYYFYCKPHFEYDEKTGLYNRFEFSSKQIDANNNEQIAVKNIIFQNCPSEKYADTAKGPGYLNISLSGSGEGKFFTEGKMVDITWSKDGDRGVTHYYYQDGTEIELNPGQTWVCIIENQYADKSQFYATVKEFEDAK